MAVSFNGDGVDFRRTANLPGLDSFTLMGWGYAPAASTLVTTAQPGQSFYFNYYSDGGLYFGSGHYGVSNDFASAPGKDTWYHWFVRGASGSIEAGWRTLGQTSYTKRSVSITTTPDALTGIWLADNTSASINSQNGRQAGAKLYDVTLTDDEVLQESYTLLPRRFADLNLATPMVAAVVADAAKDIGPNGRDWNVLGSPALAQGPPIPWGAGPIVVQTPAAGVTGTLDASLSLAFAATAAHGVAGTLAGTLAITADIAGIHAPPVDGTLAGTLGLSMAATGAHGVAGTLAGVLTVSMAAEGSFAPEKVTGTLAGSLSLAFAAAGAHGVAGTLAGTLGLSMSADGTFAQDVTGTLAATLTLSMSAAGVYGIVREDTLIPVVNNLEQIRKAANAILGELQSYLPGYGGALPDVDSVPDGKLFVRNDEAVLYQKQNGAWVTVDGTP